MTSGIYSITHTGSGKFYIGSSVNVERRWGDHKKLLRRGAHHSRALQHAWNKYGEGAFAFETLISCVLDKLQGIEQIAINEFAPAFNMTLCVDAPMRGKKHTAETRTKIVKKRAGQVFTAETRARISTAGKGRKHSEEAKRKMSITLAGRKLSAQQCEAMSARMKGVPGRPVSDAVKKQIAAKLKGHSVTQATRDAVRLAHLGTKASDETRRKMSEAQKARLAVSGGLSAEARVKIGAANKINAAARSVLITHCPRGHEYSKENTYHGAHNSRSCRMCSRDRKRVTDALKKQPTAPLTIEQE